MWGKKKWRICDWWSDYANASPLLPEIFFRKFPSNYYLLLLLLQLYYYYYILLYRCILQILSLPPPSSRYDSLISLRTETQKDEHLPFKLKYLKKKQTSDEKYDKIILYNYNSTEHYVCYYTNMLYYKEIRRFKVNILTEDYYVLRNHEATSSPN